MATRFIGFRDEADTLRSKFRVFVLISSYRLLCCNFLFPGALRIAQEHAKELEKKLEASEKARKDAEAKAASAEDLQIRLNAAESALNDRDEQIAQREADITARLDKQSDRFSSTVILSLL